MTLRFVAIAALAVTAAPFAHAQNRLLDYVNDLYKPLATVTSPTLSPSFKLEDVAYTITLKDIAPPAAGYDPRLLGKGVIAVESEESKRPVAGSYRVTFTLKYATQAGKLSVNVNGYKTSCSVKELGVGQSATCVGYATLKGERLSAELSLADSESGLATYVPDVTVARVPAS